MVSVVGFTDERESKRTRSSVRRMPAVPIAGVEPGARLKVSGTVVPWGREVSTPVTGMPCVLCEAEAYEGITEISTYHGGNLERAALAPAAPGVWSFLDKQARGYDFVIADDTGHALVRVAGALVLFGEDSDRWVIERSILRAQYVASCGASSAVAEDERMQHRFIRYRETTLVQGERVSVVGSARWEPAPPEIQTGAAYRAPQQWPVFSGANGTPVIVVQEPPPSF